LKGRTTVKVSAVEIIYQRGYHKSLGLRGVGATIGMAGVERFRSVDFEANIFLAGN
jgi:hypothetical protein